MEVSDRIAHEALEHQVLSSDAAFSDSSLGRSVLLADDDLRTAYQRDRDRIVHAKSFRRLSHKTQVFLAPAGDHFRTRLTHTLEVAQIARTIARALGLNEDLTEAIALGHDLGHTPFGHAGEQALCDCLARYAGTESDSHSCEPLFRHNVQSLRVVDVIENNGRGLNLTEEVRDGILCHTGSQRAKTLEGRIVALADRIAYVNHDIDDAIRAGALRESDLPDSTHQCLGADHSARIATLVSDTVSNSSKTGDIALQPAVYDAMMELRSFLFQEVYTAPAIICELDKARHLIEELFLYYCEHPGAIPAEHRRIPACNHCQTIVDYIAGMTDRFAKTTYEDLFVPRSFTLGTDA